MKIETGYIYHIKDKFFDVINDKGLMVNHENSHSRPTYFTIKDKDILKLKSHKYFKVSKCKKMKSYKNFSNSIEYFIKILYIINKEAR